MVDLRGLVAASAGHGVCTYRDSRGPRRRHWWHLTFDQDDEEMTGDLESASV